MTNLTNSTQAINAAGQKASFIDERYGKHPRNTFDIWLAKSDAPTPLVIYIHGGGFVAGDKSKYYDMPDWIPLLENGISIATINYRFMNEAPYGILASMNDSKHCLQYIRYHANKYNIDKNRIACCGGSAGAGTSLWLAFSDNMAEPENEDPVLRESTKITCAGAFSTQATYDFYRWDDVFNFQVSKLPEAELFILQAFGFNPSEKINTQAQTEIRNSLDLLGKMHKNAAPIFVKNHYENKISKDPDTILHHPLHAKALKEKAERVGLEAIVCAPALGIEDESGKSAVDFFIEKLKKH